MVAPLLLAAASLAAPAAADGEKHYDPSACPKSVRCGDSVDVHYPFFLGNASYTIEGYTAYSYCGYPGMAIACDDDGGRATLRLKDSNYTVLSIDYDNHTATVADSDVLDGVGGDCPWVTHNVTVPAETWLNLSTTANDNLSFFSGCGVPPPQAVLPINCTGFPAGRDGTSSSYVAAQNDVPPWDPWPLTCKEVIVVPVLRELLLGPDVEYLRRLNSDGYGKLLKKGFQLTWDPSAGPCYFCEKSGGQCSYNQSGQFLGCLCSDGRVRNPDCDQIRHLNLSTLLFTLVLLTSLPHCKPQSDTYFRYSNCTPTPYHCGPFQFDVGYPFSVNGMDRPDYCSFPGYRLSCTDAGKLTMTMTTMTSSASGSLLQVTNVDYDNHLLAVVDQGLAGQTCEKPYRNTTIDDAMFAYTDRDQFLTAYINCSATSSSLPFAFDIFSCLSGGRSYYRLDNGTVAPDLLGSCSSTLVLPFNSSMAASLAAGNSTLGDAIRGGFALRWKAGVGWCGDCRNSGGFCGYNSSSPGDHTCFCPHGTSIGSCSSGPKKSAKLAIAIGSSIAATVLFVLLVVMTCLYIRKRRQYKMTSSSRLLKYTASGGTPRSRGSTDMDESGSVHSLQTHHFTYEELEEATDSFSGAMEIADGGFGTVYKGQLRDGRVVAVKRLYNNSCRRVEQFLNEAAILSRLRHPNLVLFYGCTSSRSRELLLVYEFVPNGTVADHLHGHRASERALTWPLRLSIAVEAAAALAYLHAVDPPIVHRDVKTSNILLDAGFHVKVADFGLSRLFPADATHVSTAPQGTPGYVDPEYHRCYQLTDRSDVYSFGVVLVELVSSKPPVDVTRDRSEINLAGMAVSKIQQCRLEQLVDMGLGYGSDEATTKAMTMVAELAFRCLQQNGEMRPPIREVLDALRSIQDGGLVVEKKKDAAEQPRSPNTVHAPWDSMSTTPSVSSQGAP
ncbi:hypothetical protein HU200_019072 [Digitaria exilis]|uniref:non-specific serine/threonine protein kinase n=1 Tax=Digitaria exilis TaxID=1010633 RepID=A0A835KHF0_9POAL|nr:hypothetical protein HU200_019072 [Digitaria exilis]